MFKIKKLCTAAVLLAASQLSAAAIVSNGLTGSTDYDGWDDLGSVAGYGSSTTWPAAMDSFEVGSGDAGLDRLSGAHYSASFGLYSFSGTTVFSVMDSTAISDIKTVVFSLDALLGADDEFGNPIALFSNPVLNYNGGTQSLASDYSFETTLPTQTGTPFGDVDPVAYTFQWDLKGLLVTDFSISWEQQNHSSLRALQLEQSDNFSVANAQVVPVSAAFWLFSSACLGLGYCKTKWKSIKNSG